MWNASFRAVTPVGLVIDSVSLCLFVSRGLYLTVLLFVLYLVLIFVGMREWRRALAP